MCNNATIQLLKLQDMCFTQTKYPFLFQLTGKSCHENTFNAFLNRFLCVPWASICGISTIYSRNNNSMAASCKGRKYDQIYHELPEANWRLGHLSALLYLGCKPQLSLKDLPEAQRTEHCLESANGFKTETAKSESLWKDKMEWKTYKILEENGIKWQKVRGGNNFIFLAAIRNCERLKSIYQEYSSRTVLQTISFSVPDKLQRIFWVQFLYWISSMRGVFN